ncbi:MAG TPA: tetratricopeptide repeat protein [Aquabacterium sp.]|uniref:tetratricopeptide repeat protein n=1 Tax=Aquabacterium sp. TaxID=1872578 RepID=UPI002E2F3E24|nr:tetratricopeptide repeat protein [Aquabacterium sp.]HEX5374286.1 tetratricopeptide repeat protein [Aquabacterium sp.]
MTLLSWEARAEIMDDMDVRREGNNAVVQIRLTAPVTLVRSTVSRSRDMTQAYYKVSRTVESPVFVQGERRIFKVEGLPTITVADEPVRADLLTDTDRRLVISFSQGTRFKIRAGKGERVIEIVLQGLGAAFKPGAALKPRATDVAEAGTGLTLSGALEDHKPGAMEEQAKALLASSRLAYEQQRLDAAAADLHQLLALPANASTQDAQELLGQVRLAQGDKERARAEFESYLKQYPTGPGADRVSAALASLQQTPAQAPAPVDVPKPPDGTPTVTGSISQFYYGGQSTVETQTIRDTDGTLLSPDQIDLVSQPPISGVDQQMLTTNADATWRSRDSQRDIKFVVRDQYDYNMIGEDKLNGKSRHRNRLSAAYLDYHWLTQGVATRVGRQSAMWGGEGRYDGASASYVFKPKWKASVAAGVPTDKVAASNRYFIGAALDADALTPNIGASLFTVQRMIDGEVDRRSVGMDVRYFTQNGSLMLSTDYDVLFKKLNVASVQGMYLGEGNTTVNVLYERRSLIQTSLGQALFFQFPDLQLEGFLPQSIDDLKARGYTAAQLRELIRVNTSYTTHAMASVTKSISAQWQLGVDVHLNRIGSIAPNAVLPSGQADSGTQRTLGLQAIGTNLYSDRDTSVLAGSVMNSSLVKVRQFSYNNMTALGDAWQLEPSVRWLRSVVKDTTSGLDIVTTAWGPGLKVAYKVRSSITLESNLNVDYTRTNGVSTNDNSTRYTYFLGYRYTY